MCDFPPPMFNRGYGYDSSCGGCRPCGGCNDCGGLYPYQGNFGCAPPVVNHLTKPFSEAQELATFPVIPYPGPSTTSMSANILCTPCKQTNPLWLTEVSTSLCCPTSISNIALYNNGVEAPTPTLPGNAVAVNKIVVWLNPCALPGPVCSVDASLVVTGVPTNPTALGAGVFRFTPSIPVSMGPNCPGKIEFSFNALVGGTTQLLTFDFSNDAISMSDSTVVARLKLRYC